MRTPDHFTYMRNAAGYSDRAPDPQQQCRHCDNFEAGPSDQHRCNRGRFFVRKGGTCKNFDAATVGATS